MTTYIDSEKIRFDEVTAPATPSSGKVIMYAKTDGYVYTKDDSGLETRLGNSYWDYEEILGVNGAFDITLASIPNWSSSVKSIEMEIGLRGTVSATSDNAFLFFNSDTTVTNYYRQMLGATSGATTAFAEATPVILVTPAATSPSGSFTQGRLYIASPNSTSSRKVVKVDVAGQLDTTVMRVDSGAMVWAVSPVAITSIKIRTDNNPTDLFVAGSLVRLKFIR